MKSAKPVMLELMFDSTSRQQSTKNFEDDMLAGVD